LLAERLIDTPERKPGETTEAYRVRTEQADTLAVLVARGELEIPSMSEAEQAEARRNAESYERGRSRVHDAQD
jgi:hypothetical protein